MEKIYGGIGSRKTPEDIMVVIKDLAKWLAEQGWTGRSGGAKGADTAFQHGSEAANGDFELYRPKYATPEAIELASQFHPAWHNCNDYARKLHGRNTQHQEFRICKDCKEELPAERFEQANYKGNKYRLNTCRKCRANRKTEVQEKRKRAEIKAHDLKRLNSWKDSNRGTIEGFIYSNLYRWRKRSIKKCGVKSDLTFDYLIDLWKKQQGKCYYLQTLLDPLAPKLGSRKQLSKNMFTTLSPSLDRIDPKKGYVRGNIVWCSFAINSMKGDLTEFDFKEICSKIASSS